MPIVIHEFDVITAPPTAPAEPAASEPVAAPGNLRPEDIEAIWRVQELRAERLRAD